MFLFYFLKLTMRKFKIIHLVHICGLHYISISQRMP